ncbi:GGDEF domain-containing protein [Ponticoccus sp. SC6-36]|nr:GGDEF domain-containing protein [Ponticoccus sp. SC6-36]
MIAAFVGIEIMVVVMVYVVVLLLFPDPWAVMHLCIISGLVISAPVVGLLLAILRNQSALQDKLAEIATTDMLTGLPNRRAFLSAVAPDGHFARAGILVLADADHFKRINDTYGHDVGDACLRAIAEALRKTLSDVDIAARYGGEEFVMFYDGADATRLDQLARTICAPIRIADAGLPEGLSLTLSAGALITDAGQPTISAYRDADRALYRAKSEGRARMVAASALQVCEPVPAQA